jgi:formylglycine-generating enzyme required for sulfatase activity
MEADSSELLSELSAVNPVVAARCLLEGGAQASEGTRGRLSAELVARLTGARGDPPVARAQAGAALAELGDPRDLQGLVTVPAGPFLMGSSESDEMAFDDEKPQHEVTPPAFKIGKYPVTNAQFGAFVAAGGYEEPGYWTEAGWERKEKRGWRGPRDNGRPYNLPNHPVVGVSWYEAAAYCAWLTDVWWAEGRIAEDERARLPTEVEWEKAARGPSTSSGCDPSTSSGLDPSTGFAEHLEHSEWKGQARRYPWGDDPDPDKANCDETGIGTTSAVGCFPDGASPYGAQDMSGNVWEWTCSHWKAYPYDPSDEGEDLRAGDDVLRVLRGGAFDYHLLRLARCASRLRLDPYLRFRLIGFRVVVAPFSRRSGL